MSTKSNSFSVIKKVLTGIIFILAFFLVTTTAHADVLDPWSPITTCGEIATWGDYSLGADIDAGSAINPCFTISTGIMSFNQNYHSLTGRITFINTTNDIVTDMTWAGSRTFVFISSDNRASLYSPTTFNDGSSNWATVESSALFTNNSVNYSSVVMGAKFENYAFNYGTVYGNATFACDSANYGNVFGTINYVPCSPYVWYRDPAAIRGSGDYWRDWRNVDNWYILNNNSSGDYSSTNLIPTASFPGLSSLAILIGSIAPTINLSTWFSSISGIDSTRLTGVAGATGPRFINNGDGSGNNVTVTGNASFMSNAYNSGYVTGNITLYCGASNYLLPGGSVIVDPACVFPDDTGGPALNNVYFYSDGNNNDWTYPGNWFSDTDHLNSTSIPDGTSDVIILDGTAPAVNLDNNNWIKPHSIDASALTAPSGIMFFNGGSMTSPNIDITGNATFGASTYNDSTITGSVVFNDGSYNAGTVGGNAEFTGSSYGFNPTGVVGGSITFSSVTPVLFTIPSDGWVANTTNWIFTTAGQSWIFNTNAHNEGTIVGEVVFNNSSLNAAYIVGTTTLNGSSRAFSGSITGATTFNNNSSAISGSIIGDVTFNASSTGEYQLNITGNVTLNDSSHADAVITGNLKIDTTWYANGVDSARDGILLVSGVNKYWYTTVSGTITGSDNTPVTSFVFDNGSMFSGRTTPSQVTFNNNSRINSGTISGNATFNNSYSASGTFITGNATFTGTSTNLSAISGTASAYYPVIKPLGGTANGGKYYYDYPDGLYFHSATNNGDWNDLGNWWESKIGDVFSSPATQLPTIDEKVYIYSNLTSPTGVYVDAKSVNFYGTSTNGIKINTTDGATFYDFSANNGDVVGGAVFYGNDTYDNGTVSSSANYTWTQHTSLGARNWNSVTSSSDGTNLAAAVFGGGYIYTSTTSGATWTQQTLSGSRSWLGITSSSDGTKLAAAVYGNGYIYTSTTSGATWTQQTLSGFRSWYGITSSSDGTKLAAITSSGYIYTSSDSGSSWTERTLPGAQQWQGITSSSDGSVISASSYNGIHTSVDYGATWNVYALSGNKFAITASSNGLKLAFAAANGYIYTSTNSGATWTQRTSAGERNWISITSSSDGTKLVAAVSNGFIYTSNDSGVTWTEDASLSAKSWRSLDMSSDGSHIIAGSNNSGYVYTYSSQADNTGTVTRIFNSAVTTLRKFAGLDAEGGRTDWIVIAQGVIVDISNAVYNTATNIFKALSGGIFNYGSNTGGSVVPQITIASTTIPYIEGDESTKILRWAPSIDWGNSTSCMYSYDNFVSTTSVACSANDATLPRPTGVDANVARTLYLRGTNAGNISEKSITYFYDKTTPISTTCGASVLDEDRTYYLASNTIADCTVTASATIQGATSTTAAPKTLTGSINVVGTGLTVTLENMIVSSSTISNGNDLIVKKSMTGLLSVDGVSTTTTNANGGDAGEITVSTSSIATGISANGGNGGANGGNAGSIYTLASAGRIAGANITTVVSANGGDSTYCGYGGNGGTISLVRSRFSTSTVSAGADRTATVASGGHCANPPAGQSGSSGHHTSEGTFTAGSDFPDQSETSTTGTDNTNTNTNTSNSGARSFIPGIINSITLPVQKLSPLKIKDLPTFGTDTKGSFSFLTPLQNFLFAPMPKGFTDTFATTPKLLAYLKTLGISASKDLFNLQKNPIALPDNSKDVAGIWYAYSKGIPVRKDNNEFTTATQLSIDSKLSGNKKDLIFQTLKVSPGATFTVSLIPTDKRVTKGVFAGKEISFKKEGTKLTSTITVSKRAGTYTLTSKASPLPLTIEVVDDTQKNTNSSNSNSGSVWGKIRSFFSW